MRLVSEVGKEQKTASSHQGETRKLQLVMTTTFLACQQKCHVFVLISNIDIEAIIIPTTQYWRAVLSSLLPKVHCNLFDFTIAFYILPIFIALY